MSSGIYILVEHQKGVVEDISYVMLAASKVLAQKTGDEIVALLLGHDVKDLAGDLAADKVVYFEHIELQDFSPDAYIKVLAPYFDQNPPRAFIAGHTSVGSQVCGGKIMVEGELPEPSVMISFVPGSYKIEQGKSEITPDIEEGVPAELHDLRIRLVEYIDPDSEDVDISKADVLIAVGRGLQNENDLELVEELAEKLGGEVCSSRPIIDQGWLPASRLVGKSGKNVMPKVYIALGISGAPEHTQAITESDLIIAVNTDPAAPIFNIAQYGAEIDLIDFVSVMNEHLQAVKSV
jgi:electron transfer flavoprotein alpha subunit